MCIRDRVYGVDVEDARQIPLKKYIEGCINGEEDHDINQYAETNKPVSYTHLSSSVIWQTESWSVA